MALPDTVIGTNIRLVGYSDANGVPNLGEGMAMSVQEDGRYLLWIAHANAPLAYSLFDVTRPDEPVVLCQEPLPHSDMRANNLSVCGTTMLLTNQTSELGATPAGFHILDISEPEAPRAVGFFDAAGPHSRGAHFASLMDGRYAHVSTGAPDFEPTHPADNQFYMIVDLLDPSQPTEVGRWWLPGQRRGDTSPPPTRHHGVNDIAFRVHNVLSYPQRPDRAYLGYIDGGIVVLDISDKNSPQLVSRIDYHPPFPGFTHTVLPLLNRDLLIVTDEAWHEEGADLPKKIWLVDVRDETNPVIIGTMPDPPEMAQLAVGGRIGAHNVHENEPGPGSAQLENVVVATMFAAGIRIYDIRDPFRPEEIAAFVPKAPEGQNGSRINDVFVDDRGFIYAADRASGGLYVLEYTGSHPLN